MPNKAQVARVPRWKQWLARALNMQGIPSYSGGGSSGMYWPGAVLESFTGAWQQNVVAAPASTLLSFPPVYACVTGIAQDVGKMRVKLSEDRDGVWEEVTANKPWLPLLREPNDFQDIQQFLEHWLISELIYGNTYILKGRDQRGIVNRMWVLHPSCIRPLVAENGDVYYELYRDDLSGLTEEKLAEIGNRYGRFAIPASEIIHDRLNPLWHPLVGVSPLYASGASATLGSTIQSAAAKFFSNKSLPGGMLAAPGAISDETAGRLKATFESNFSGDNIGKLLVVGDGLEFKQFSIDAQHAQQKEQLDQAIDAVAIAFRYPRWKLAGSQPPYTKPDQAQTMYYTDCLGPHIVRIEKRLDRGLELPNGLHCEFDLDELMRMDQTTLYESLSAAGDFLKLDEQRFRANYGPVKKGGNTVYKQEQDHSVEWLADRDALGPPPVKAPTAPATEPTPTPSPAPERMTLTDFAAFRKRLAEKRPLAS